MLMYMLRIHIHTYRHTLIGTIILTFEQAHILTHTHTTRPFA